MKVSIQIQGFNGVVTTVPEEVEPERVATVLGLCGSTPSISHRVIFPDFNVSVTVNFDASAVTQPFFLTFDRLDTGIRMVKMTVDPKSKIIHMFGHVCYCPHPVTLMAAESFSQAGPTLSMEFASTAGVEILQCLLGFPFKEYDPSRQTESFEAILDDCSSQGYTWIQVSERPPRFKLI
jgi:hypothetical protein